MAEFAYAYPGMPEFLAASKLGLAKLRGEAVPLDKALNAVWTVVGFGLSNVPPDSQELRTTKSTDRYDAAVAETVLANAITAVESNSATALDWKQLLDIALTLFKLWRGG